MQKRVIAMVLACLVFLCYVNVSFASVISEIQFDPAGTDTDREWIEIFNDTGTSVDLTTYKFFENNTNHGIDVLSGDKNLVSGEYAVLVQDLNKFKIDYPAYSGKIFKSSFSLSNTGESLSLKDKDGNILNTVNYLPSATGAGTGLTINLNSDGSYSKGSATPGTGNLVAGTGSGTTDTGNNNSTTTSATSTQTTTTASTTTAGTQDTGGFSTPIYYYRSYYPESEKIYVYAGENQLGVTGGTIFFTGRAVTGDKKTVNGATFFWSFGDGETDEGMSVHHVYKYPGEYVVNLEGYSNGSRNEDRIYVKISDPQLSISLNNISEEKVVQVNNKSNEQVDLGGYLIKTSGGEFEKVYTIGKHLTILPRKSTTLSQDLLKFATGTTDLALAYSSGKVVSQFSNKTIVSVNNLPKNKTINILNSTTTNTNIKVFTKDDFEKFSLVDYATGSISTSLDSTSSIKSSSKFKKLLIKNPATPKNLSQEKLNVIDTTSNFVTKNDEQSIFHTFLNYFGI